MKTIMVALCLGLVLAGCANEAPAVECPVPADVAPASIGGAAYVTGLTARLAGDDRENSITEAIGEIRSKAPELGSAAIVDILIAADCPNAVAMPDRSETAVRARIAAFRAQVEQLLQP